MSNKILDAFEEYTPSTARQAEIAEEKTKELQNKVFWESIVEPVFNWADGAVKGMQEITRAGNQRATVDPQAFMGNDPFTHNQINTETKPVSTPEPEVQETSIKQEPRGVLSDVQVEAADWYKKAVRTYTDETVKPAVIAGTIAAMPFEGVAIKAFTHITTYPMLMEMGIDNIQKYGLWEGAKETGTSLFIPKGTYDTFTSEDPNMKAYRERYPLKAFLGTAAQDMMMLHPAYTQMKTAGLKLKAEYLRRKHKNATEAEIAEELKRQTQQEQKPIEEQIKDAIEEQTKPKEGATEAPKEQPDPTLTVEDVIKEATSEPPKTERTKTGDRVVDALDDVINNREQKGIIREDTYDRVADFILSDERLGNMLMSGNVKPVIKAVQKKFGIDEVKAAKVLRQIYTGEEAPAPTPKQRIEDAFEPEENIQAMRKPRNTLEEMNDGARPEVKEELDNITRQAEAEIKQKQEAQAETQKVAEEELRQPYQGVNGEVKPSASNITDRVDWLDVMHTARSFTDVKVSSLQKIKGILGYFAIKSKEIKVSSHQGVGTICHELGHFADRVLKIHTADKGLLELTRKLFGASEFEDPTPKEKSVMSFLKEYINDKNNAKVLDPAMFKFIDDAIIKDNKVKVALDDIATKLKIDAELVNAATKIFGNGYKPSQRRGEGIAEFFHEYLYNPEQAKLDYPEFHAAFEKAIAEHPELRQKLDLLGNQVRKVLSQHGFEAGRAAIETTEDVAARKTEGMTRLDKIIAKGNEMGDKYRTTMLDEFAKVRDLMKKWQEETGITLPSYANIADLMQAARSTTPARLALALGVSGISPKLAIKALRQVYGGIQLHEVVFKDVLDSLKNSYKAGDITTDFLDLCGKKNGKRATVYEAFMTFTNALSNWDIIKNKRAESIAKSEATIKTNANKREKINREYDREFKKLDKRRGEALLKQMGIGSAEIVKSVEHLKKIMLKEKDRLLKKFAKDKIKTKDIEDLFDRRIQELTDKVSETIGKMGYLTLDELQNTYHGKRLNQQLNSRIQKRDKARQTKEDTLVGFEENNARKGKYVSDAMDVLELEIEETIGKIYGKVLERHKKSVDSEVTAIDVEIGKLVKKMAQDKRLRDLAESDVLETTNISETRAGNRDYKTNISHRSEMGYDDLAEIVKAAPKSFYKSAKLLRQYNDNLLELAIHFGFFDRKRVEQFKKDRPHYSPLERSFSEENADYVDIHNFMAKLSAEGSDRTVKDPLMAIQNRTEALIVRGERNKIKRAWTGFAFGEQNKNSLVSWLPEGNPEAQRARGVFEVYMDGKKHYFQAKDGIVYDAIMNMDAESSALYNNVLNAASRALASTLRVTATQTPAFMVWNMLRDTITASVNSQATKQIPTWMTDPETGEKIQYTSNKQIPIYDTIEGFVKLSDNFITKKLRTQKQQEALDMAYAQFYAQGVPFATRRGSDAKVTKEWMNYIQGNEGTTRLEKNWHIVSEAAKTSWGWYTSVGERVEQAPRFQEFLRTLQQGGSVFEAGTRARDLTTNFARHGTVSKTINQHIPFFNATMQGTQTMYRAWKRDKQGFMLKAAGWVTAPTIMLWMMNHDQDWYKNLPAAEKDKNWFFKVGDTIYRYPKPELLGYMFGTLPEIMLNAASGDDRSFKDSQIGSMVQDSMLPMGFPTAVLAITQWKANYDFYRNRQIVPDSLLDKPDEEQYTDYTSGVAIQLGQLTGKSPMKIDSTMRTVLSSMGNTALGISDAFAKESNAPDRPWKEKMRFFYNEHGKTRTQDVFYERYRDMKKRSKSKFYKPGKDRDFDRNWGVMKSAYKKAQKMWKEYNAIMSSKLPDDVKIEKLNAKKKEIDNFMRKANNQSGYKYIQAPK